MKVVGLEACYCSDFCSFWRILKNKGSFGWKTVNSATFSEMDRKIRVSGQNYLYFWDFVEKKKIWNSNMPQARQLSLSNIFSPAKFIFRPAVQGGQMFTGLQRPLPVHLEKKLKYPWIRIRTENNNWGCVFLISLILIFWCFLGHPIIYPGVKIRHI